MDNSIVHESMSTGYGIPCPLRARWGGPAGLGLSFCGSPEGNNPRRLRTASPDANKMTEEACVSCMTVSVKLQRISEELKKISANLSMFAQIVNQLSSEKAVEDGIAATSNQSDINLV